MGPRMPCHISDGPQTPEDQAEMNEYVEEDEDPTPWCHWCGARDQDQCDCGPIAANH
jgi:hypothetical protein